MNIPAGTCNFDLPRLHHWLNESEQKKKEEIRNWSSDLNPINHATYILLDNIRKSSSPINQNAASGFYHQQIESNASCQLIRIKIHSESPFYPDISGIKNRFTVRFMEVDTLTSKQVQTKGKSEENPGYKGRAGIYQVMPISEDLKRLIIEGANAVQLADQADKEGTWNIRRSGLQKAADGITSLAEVNRVTLD